MVKGFLKIYVLESLLHKEQSGAEIASFIEQIFGKKPSRGSLYPLLNDLHERKLVRVQVQGRKKVYTITKKGQRRLEEIQEEKNQLFTRHVAMHEKLNAVTGDDDLFPIDNLRSLCDTNCKEFASIFSRLNTLRKEWIAVFSKPKFVERNLDEILAVLDENIARVKTLRKKK